MRLIPKSRSKAGSLSLVNFYSCLLRQSASPFTPAFQVLLIAVFSLAGGATRASGQGASADYTCSSPNTGWGNGSTPGGAWLAAGYYNYSFSTSIDDQSTASYVSASFSTCAGGRGINSAGDGGSGSFNWGGGYCNVSIFCSANNGPDDSGIQGVVRINANFALQNQAPWANDSYYSTNEDTWTNWVGLNVGDGDSNLSDCPTGSSYLPGSFGRSGCSFWFSPNANWSGVAWFDFYAVDSWGWGSGWRRAYITVNAVNDAPWANDSYYTINEDGSTGWVGLDVGDVDGNLSDCATGSSSLPGAFSRSGCSIIFTPNANWNGVAWVDFYAADSNSATSAWRRAYITVNTVNDPPTSSGGSFSTNEDTAYSGTLACADIDSGTINRSIVAGPANASAVVTNAATGAFTFTPNADWNGSTSFTFKCNDGQYDSNTSTMSVTVNAVNDAPVSSAGSFSTNEDTSYSGTLACSDIDSGTISRSIVAGPANGNVNITNSTTGAFTFTPNADWNGSTSFTYKCNDGALDSGASTISVTVNAINDPPTLNALSDLNVNSYDGDFTVALSGIGTGAANETQTLTVTASSGDTTLIPHPTVSYASPAATGSLTVSPVNGNTGTATITVTVNDGAASTIRTFTITNYFVYLLHR